MTVQVFRPMLGGQQIVTAVIVDGHQLEGGLCEGAQIVRELKRSGIAWPYVRENERRKRELGSRRARVKEHAASGLEQLFIARERGGVVGQVLRDAEIHDRVKRFRRPIFKK